MQQLGGTRDFTFGAAGHQNQVANGANIIDFNSDAEGRLAELDRLGNTAAFLYDGRSFLARAEEGGTGNFTEPTYASDGLLYSLNRSEDGGATTTREHVVYFAGRPVAIVSVPSVGAANFTFLSTDHLGTPFVAMDATGEEIWEGGFEPFGRDWRAGLPDGAQENGVFLRFPGQWFDGVWEAASLGAEAYYNVYRWYAPDNGTYTRSDPVGLDAGVNLLSYLASNPVNGFDLTGLLEHFTFVLNSDTVSRLDCSCGLSFVAFSGVAKARNDPAKVDQENVGPIPPGRYFIVDRRSGGRLGWLRDWGSGKSEWFALYRDDGVIDDETIINGVSRGDFRLHPGTISRGCVTLRSKKDFEKLRRLLLKTKTQKIPGTSITYYGTITVTAPKAE